MKYLFTLILILFCLGFLFSNPLFIQPNEYYELTSRFSYFSFITTSVFTLYCLFHIAINFDYAKKIGLSTQQIILMPSTLIPVIIIGLSLIPTLWSIIDKKFRISFAFSSSLNETVMLTVISYTLLLIGIVLGKKNTISKLIQKKKIKRNLDFILKANNNAFLSFVIFLVAIISFFINTSFRFDLFIEGGRVYEIESYFLLVLLPLGYILSTLATIISGFLYSKTKKKYYFIIPLLDIIPRMIRLSRAFYLPFIYFVFAAAFLGTNIPTWLYWLLLPLVIIYTQISVTAREVSSGGISGLFSGLENYQLDFMSTIRNFMETNSSLGVNSNVFAFRDHSQSFFEGLAAWVTALSPLPSFIIPLSIPNIHELKRLNGIGIPMPVIGEPYYLMGWLGVMVFLFIGWWIGRVEGNLIFHTRVYGQAYWPHVLIWISMLYGVILSFHSGIRGCSRPLFYSVTLIWLLEAIVKFQKGKHIDLINNQASNNFNKLTSQELSGSKIK